MIPTSSDVSTFVIGATAGIFLWAYGWVFPEIPDLSNMTSAIRTGDPVAFIRNIAGYLIYIILVALVMYLIPDDFWSLIYMSVGLGVSVITSRILLGGEILTVTPER